MKEQPNRLYLQIVPLQAPQEPPLSLDVACFEFFRSGADHLLFRTHHHGWHNQLLIFRQQKQETGKYTELDQIFRHEYKEWLSHQPISAYIVPKVLHTITNSQEDFERILTLLQNLIPKKGTKIRNDRCIESSFNILNTQDCDWIVQFKPKTPLPNVFHEKSIQKMMEKFNMTRQALANILAGAMPIEKTRWFKKKLKESSSCHNQNPLMTFGILPATSLFDLTATKNYKFFSAQITEEQKQMISASIRQNLQQNCLLSHIYDIQSCHFGAAHQISEGEMDKELIQQAKVLQFSQSLPKRTPNLSNLLPFLEIFDCIDSQTTAEEASAQNIYLYLVSLTWRDVSIIVRKDRQKGLQTFIIDCDLKEACKVRQNLRKDEKHLQFYLKHKIGGFNKFSDGE